MCEFDIRRIYKQLVEIKDVKVGDYVIFTLKRAGEMREGFVEDVGTNVDGVKYFEVVGYHLEDTECFECPDISRRDYSDAQIASYGDAYHYQKHIGSLSEEANDTVQIKRSFTRTKGRETTVKTADGRHGYSLPKFVSDWEAVMRLSDFVPKDV